MPHVRRFKITDSQSAELWARWKRGESLTAIARALTCGLGSVFWAVVREGGIAPTPRRRSRRVLSTQEREEISRGLAAGETYRRLARRLQRAPSTISREIARHGGASPYRAADADAQAWQAARRPKPCRLSAHPALCRIVAAQLARKWSPEQIAGWLKVTYADDPAMQVSHETIYRSLFVQSRGVLKNALQRHLRRRRPMRRARTATRKGQPGRGDLADTVSIRERPAAVEDRAVPGLSLIHI